MTDVFGRTACDMIGLDRHCCGEDLTLPSPGTLAQMWSDPEAICPHPEGSQWTDAALVPLPVLPSVQPGAAWLDVRADGCMRCAKHLGAYRCAANGGKPVNHLVLNRDASCPDDPPVWVAVATENKTA